MTKRTYFLLIFWGFCAMWEKAGAWITLGKPELTGPFKSLVGSIEEFYCKLDEIHTNETILYQLFNERNLNKSMGEYSSHSKEKAKFLAFVSLAHDGRLMCKASVQNNSDIIPTSSNWIEFHALVPVEGAQIISTPSSGDLWEGDSLTLGCRITEGTYVLYKWFLNDRLLHYNSDQLHILSLSSKDSGNYVCVAKNVFNETDYFNSTSAERKIHVKEYLSKPEISFKVIKNAEGNFSAYVKCHVAKGSWPVMFTFFRNEDNVTAIISEHQHASFTVLIALDQDMGTAYCQANNGKNQLQSRKLNLTVESVGGTVTVRLNPAVGQVFEVTGVRLYCRVERGTFPQYYWFLNNRRLEKSGSFYKTVHQDDSGLDVMLYPHSDSAGFYHCEAVNSFDNTTRTCSQRTLIGHEVLNKIPTEVAAVVFTCFSLLICAVLACCIYGAVLRKKRARVYMFRLKDFTGMHGIVGDDDDDDDDDDDVDDENTEEIDDNIFEEEHDDLDTEAYIEDIEVVQASMMKDSDESDEEEEEEEEEEENNLHYHV